VTPAVEIRRNSAHHDVLVSHLIRSDPDFVPRLSIRVTIDEYATKLEQSADRFEAWISDQLVGVVAMYCNDPRLAEAFITSVSVDPAARNQGLASLLLDHASEYAAGLGFARAALEVDGSNGPAMALYSRAGFIEASRHDGALRLVKDLSGVGSLHGDDDARL
jgi:ribosomal protein S18 acetylase RimI-like enzyme